MAIGARGVSRKEALAPKRRSSLSRAATRFAPRRIALHARRVIAATTDLLAHHSVPDIRSFVTFKEHAMTAKLGQDCVLATVASIAPQIARIVGLGTGEHFVTKFALVALQIFVTGEALAVRVLREPGPAAALGTGTVLQGATSVFLDFSAPLARACAVRVRAEEVAPAGRTATVHALVFLLRGTLLPTAPTALMGCMDRLAEALAPVDREPVSATDTERAMMVSSR